MRHYFLVVDGEQAGPFSIEELKSQNINPNSLVWYQGLSEWVEAKTIAELEPLFSSPPPTPTENETPEISEPNIQRPKTWLTEAILVTLFCCLPFGVVAIVNASRIDSLYNSGRYSESIRASDQAKTWVNASFWTAVGIALLYFIGAASAF